MRCVELARRAGMMGWQGGLVCTAEQGPGLGRLRLGPFQTHLLCPPCRLLSNQVTKKVTSPLPTTDNIFYAGTGMLLCRSEEKVRGCRRGWMAEWSWSADLASRHAGLHPLAVLLQCWQADRPGSTNWVLKPSIPQITRPPNNATTAAGGAV